MAACGDDGSPTADEPDTITLVAYDSFPAPDPDNPIHAALAEFTAETGIAVETLIAGDTGTMLSKATLTAGNPEGDVMWGIDNTFLSRAVEAEIFEPYLATGVAELPAEFTELVPNGEATPVDFGDVCVNYDIAALDAAGIDPPSSLADLVQPEYAGQLVVQNPATSSPGLAFLLATIAEFGDAGWEDYWRSLRNNDVEIVDSWTQAYYESFSWAGGSRPLVVSYGSSPPFEVLFASRTARYRADRRRRIDLLSPGRVRRRAARHRGTTGRSPTRRLPDHRALPARSAVEPVRLPRRPGRRIG